MLSALYKVLIDLLYKMKLTLIRFYVSKKYVSN